MLGMVAKFAAVAANVLPPKELGEFMRVHQVEAASPDGDAAFFFGASGMTRSVMT